MSEENPTAEEQKANAEKELRAAKEARQMERDSRARRYGILNRKEELSLDVIRKARLNCNCGAAINGGLHREDCPVIKIARSKR